MAEEKFKCRLVMGDKKHQKLLYIFHEKQLFKRNAVGKNGTIYVCVHPKCTARYTTMNDVEYVKNKNFVPHNHEENAEQRFYNLAANEQIVTHAMNLNSIASGSGITKSREIYKQAMIE